MRAGGSEVGARVGTAEETGGLVVGPGSLLGGLERAEPHPDLLGGVLDLGHPPPRWPLPDAHKLAAAATATAAAAAALGSRSWLGFLCGGWRLLVAAVLLLGMALWWLLEMELH